MILNDKQFTSRYRNMENANCRICGEFVSRFNNDFVYIKTKRKSEFLVHKHCMNIKNFNTENGINLKKGDIND